MLPYILLAGAAALGGYAYYQKKHAKPAVTPSLEAGKAYALNVLAGVNDTADVVNNNIIGAQGGALFTGVGAPPQMAKVVTVWPGIDLQQNFGGQANQWIVYVRASKNMTLPMQLAATNIITSAFPIDETSLAPSAPAASGVQVPPGFSNPAFSNPGVYGATASNAAPAPATAIAFNRGALNSLQNYINTHPGLKK